MKYHKTTFSRQSVIFVVKKRPEKLLWGKGVLSFVGGEIKPSLAMLIGIVHKKIYLAELLLTVQSTYTYGVKK
jgi:hypothetical protein